MFDTGALAPGDAASATVSGNRAVRAHIKHLCAQAHAPLPGNSLSAPGCGRPLCGFPSTCPMRRRPNVVAVGRTARVLCGVLVDQNPNLRIAVVGAP